jgi:hypothetical protein
VTVVAAISPIRLIASEVDQLLAIEGSDGTLLAARATGEIVGEAESHEARLEIAEVEMGGSGQL